MADWWQGFQADVDAVDRAIEREHQAAVSDGQPWPPGRNRTPGTRNRMPPHSGANRSSSSPGQQYPGSRTEPVPVASKPGTRGPRLPGLCMLMTGAPPG